MNTTPDSFQDVALDGATITLNLPCPVCDTTGDLTTCPDNSAHYEARKQARQAKERLEAIDGPFAYTGPDADILRASLAEELEARRATLAATPFKPRTSAPCRRCRGSGWTQQPVELADALQALVNNLAKESSAAEVWEDITNTPAPTA